MIGVKQTLERRAMAVVNSRTDTALSNLKIFFEFLDSDIQLKTMMQELKKDLPDVKPMMTNLGITRRLTLPPVYLQKVKTCLSILLYMIKENCEPYQITINVSAYQDADILTKEAMREFFIPVAQYIEEKIVSIDSFQYQLIRYKLQAEWFHKESLLSSYNKDTKKGDPSWTHP